MYSNERNSSSGPSTRTIGVIATRIVLLIVAIVSVTKLIRINDAQNWTVLQSVSGKMSIIDASGWYNQAFGRIWVWPRVTQHGWSEADTDGVEGDQSFEVTFNDGGKAKIGTMVRISLPTTEEQRLKLHREFSGSPENMINSVRAHMINCAKITASLMSATENQSARKSEFQLLIQEQLNKGQFLTKRVSQAIPDRLDEAGKPMMQYVTELVTTTSGVPVIAEKSPLSNYGIEVLQFSVTETRYDDQTLAQFKAKQAAYLAAEQSKVAAESAKQEQLKVMAEGLKQKAEAEAKANVEMATATIEATKLKTVAETKATQERIVAETAATQKVAVARMEKEAAETKATQELEVAKLARQAAEEKAKQVEILATAEQKRIQIGGALTEAQEKLATIYADRDVRVAEHLSKIATPSAVFISGSGGASNAAPDITTQLVNYRLLETTGILNTPPRIQAAAPVTQK